MLLINNPFNVYYDLFLLFSVYWETLPGALGVNMVANGMAELIARLDSSFAALNSAGNDPPV